MTPATVATAPVRQLAIPALLAVGAALAGGCGAVAEERVAPGQLTSRRVDVAGVTGLAVDAGFEVRVSIGQPGAAVVTYDGDLAGLLDVGVDGGTLRARLRPHDRIGRRPRLWVEVTLRRLEQVQVAGASTVTVAGTVRGPDLWLALSGGSRVTADLGLDRADATLSGASRLELTGSAGRLEADASGASNLELAGLRLHDLDIQLSGASHANVQADRTIAAQLSGASHLIYTGSPRFTRRDTSGASAIRPA